MSDLGLRREGRKGTFTIFSRTASKIVLGIFKQSGQLETFPLERIGDLWRQEISCLPEHFTYAYQIDGSDWVKDPYEKEHLPPFDWEGVAPPKKPIKDLIIYEMHVRGLTKDSSSGVKNPGTFLGIIEKIPYLKRLGVNALELMPIFLFDTQHSYWGYDPLSFFTIDPLYLRQNGNEFKALVKELHRNGIEVLLDVVFNHTGSNAPLQIIDKPTYYLTDERGNDKNYSGCGNTLNCNQSVVQKLILDSLEYWIDEMHVDGFRFDLASILMRGEEGDPLPSPPLVDAITTLCEKKEVKLIAEPWDGAGLYLLGSFPKQWFEWDDVFRDDTRRFLKGAPSNFETRFLTPSNRIHFITAHDGFSLRDLVSYERKRNFENGEKNRDGGDENESWNCGVEGETTDKGILFLREKQMRNFFLSLLLSVNPPMLLMGDEYGHTRKGNNNPYRQDNKTNWFCWNTLQKNKKIASFVSKLIEIRKKYDLTWIQSSENTFTSKNLYLSFNPKVQEQRRLLPVDVGSFLINTEDDWEVNKRPFKTHSDTLFLSPYSAVLALII